MLDTTASSTSATSSTGSSTKLLAELASPVLVLALMAPPIALRGWVAQQFWGWWVVPLGAPALGWLQATGLVLGFWLVLPMRNPQGEGKAEMFSAMLLLPLVIYGVGAMLKWIAG